MMVFRYSLSFFLGLKERPLSVFHWFSIFWSWPLPCLSVLSVLCEKLVLFARERLSFGQAKQNSIGSFRRATADSGMNRSLGLLHPIARLLRSLQITSHLQSSV